VALETRDEALDARLLRSSPVAAQVLLVTVCCEVVLELCERVDLLLLLVSP
jgi:hypothetical protein